MKKLMLIIAALAILVMTAACTPTLPPQPDGVYCEDIAEVQKAVQQYANVDRVSVTNEVMDDLNEMGVQNRCPGYQAHGQDD